MARALLLFVAGILTPLALLAQRGENVLTPGTPSVTFVGVEAGPSFNVFSQRLSHAPIDNPSSPWRSLESGSGFGGHLSLFVRRDLAPRVGVVGRAGLELKRYTSSGTGIVDCPTPGEDGFDTVAIDLSATTSATWATLGLDVRYEVVGGFELLAGITSHWLVGSVETSLEADLAGDRCVFAETGTSHFESVEDDREGFTTERFGLELGAAWRVPVSRRLTLVPSLRLQYMLDPISPDGDVQVDDFRSRTLGLLSLSMTDRELHSVHLGLALMWGL
jgi:hypothetical protein